MASVVRQSKFRHVFGTAARKEHCYDGLRITKSNWEGSTYCAVNPKFVAIIIESAGGGAFVVQPLGKTGRIERDAPVVGGHKAEVLDIKWCPHHDEVIASCSEDCTVKIWQIPENGLTSTITDPIVDLVYHQRRVGCIEWHPTASNILVSSSADFKVCLWDVGTGEILAELQLKDVLFSLSFNFDGSRIVTACKDKTMRILDARTLEILQKGKPHAGAKAAQAVYLKDDCIFTTGFSKMSERQYALWAKEGPHSIDGGEGPLASDDIDTSNGVMFIFYDADTNVVFLAGKGDSLIRYFEIVDKEPYVYWLSNYSSTSPQRGVGFMPKRGVNVNTCEIARLYRLVQGSGNQGGYCEPIAFTVPRKSELYQDDLYPDTFGGEASLTADEWFTEGKNAGPILMSMKDTFNETGVQKAKVRASVLTGGVKKKPASSAAASKSTNGSGEPKPTATSAGPSVESSDAAASASAIENDIRKMKIIIKGHETRITRQKDRIDLLEARINLLESNSLKQNKDNDEMEAIQSANSNVSDEVTRLIEEVKALKTTVEENTKCIANLQERLADYESADAV